MSEEIFPTNHFNDMFNSLFGTNDFPFKLDGMKDERIEGEDSFFNCQLPNKLFADEDPYENQIQGETKNTTFTKKRNLPNDLLYQSVEDREDVGEREDKRQGAQNDLMEDKELENSQKQNDETVTKKKCNQGRKKFDDESEGKHTKDSEDNMVRKIKSFFVGSSHNYLNSIIIDPQTKLIKFDFYVCKELKKEFNENLFKASWKKIYETVNLSDKYTYLIKNEPDKNSQAIAKIINNNSEVEATKILNLTFEELYEIFIRKYRPLRPELRKKLEGTNILISKQFLGIEDFLAYIKNKFDKEKGKKKNQENIDDYISKIKNLCLGLQDWFKNKNGRKNRKEIKYKF